MTVVRVLYGSCARGDQDADSDVDILTVGSWQDYSWGDIDRLREYGSLFLLHLKREGRVVDASPIGAAKWRSTLANLPPYRRARSDVEAFRIVLGDVRTSLAHEDAPIGFEAAVLARTLRHAAILACYLQGVPNFSRYGSVERALDGFELAGSDGAEFPILYAAVLHPDLAWGGKRWMLDAWLDIGLELVERMEGLIPDGEF